MTCGLYIAIDVLKIIVYMKEETDLHKTSTGARKLRRRNFRQMSFRQTDLSRNGIFAERNFRLTEISPNVNFPERNFCRRSFY